MITRRSSCSKINSINETEVGIAHRVSERLLVKRDQLSVSATRSLEYSAKLLALGKDAVMPLIDLAGSDKPFTAYRMVIPAPEGNFEGQFIYGPHRCDEAIVTFLNLLTNESLGDDIHNGCSDNELQKLVVHGDAINIIRSINDVGEIMTQGVPAKV